jgi:phosphoribosyl 1,2-cyclic phosphodiesterase
MAIGAMPRWRGLPGNGGATGGAAIFNLPRRRSTTVNLIFLGTRANIVQKTRRHRRHSALLVEKADARIVVDCGADWLGLVAALRPTAIVLTHGHPDHAAGLAAGCPCPVYATAETWQLLASCPVADRRIMPIREPLDLGGVRFEAFPVEHSLRAPAVGYRLVADQRHAFYVPDVAAIPDAAAALGAVDLYIGDGATLIRPIIRRRDGARIGHAPIRTQLDWCRAQRITRAIFTHCGSQIVGGDGRAIGALVRRLGRERGIDARLAYDGLKICLGDDRGA